MELELIMTPLANRLSGRPAAPRRQRGTMLIIALIVLVAMTLAGIATMRSVDTATLVAGNIAFKQSTIGGTDQGLQSAYAWLTANAIGVTLYSDNTGAGYLSSVPALEPDWSSPTSWSNAFMLNTGNKDAAGNVISYLIHRMCPVPNCAPETKCAGVDNTCGKTPDVMTASGEGTDQGKAQRYTKNPAVHYRLTARAVGPRNSTTVVQTMVRIQ
jgi:type IV pilus assembly protein PilX